MHKLISLLFIIVLGIFCCIWQNVQIIRIGKIISEKKVVLEDLKFKNRMLEVKVANLKSLDRIENISKDKLGLTTAKEFRVVYLKNQGMFTQLADIKPLGDNKKSIFGKMFGDLISTAEANPLKEK